MNRKFKTVCSFFVASMLCIPCISTTIKAEENYNVNDSVYSTYSNNLLKASNIGKTKICQFHLSRKNAIQSFDFGQTQNEIYVTQNDKNNTTYLSRCLIDNKIATVQDSATLVGYGHGESLEVIPKSNGQADIWVGSGYNANNTNGEGKNVNWSTTISKITYNRGNISKELTITGFEDVIKEKTNLGGYSPYRVNVAFDDNSGQRIGFRVVLKNGNGVFSGPYYLIYKSSLFDNQKGIINLKNIQLSAFFNAKEGNSTNSDCPNKSFQGFDLEGTLNGKKYLYTYGGGAGQTPAIRKYLYNTTSSTPISYSEYPISSNINTSGQISEAECIKIIGNNNSNNEIYVGFNSKPQSKENGVYVHDGVYKLNITTANLSY